MDCPERLVSQAVQTCETLARALEKLKQKFDEADAGKIRLTCFRGKEGDDPHMFLRKLSTDEKHISRGRME